MLVQALIQLSAVLPLTPQGAVIPPTMPTVANVNLAEKDLPIDRSSMPSPAEFEHICEIRKLISGQHRPLGDSRLINDSSTEFRSTLFSEYQVEAPNGEPAPAATGSLQADLRQVSERLDAAANRLERRQLYETADELRELSQRLRQLSRKQ